MPTPPALDLGEVNKDAAWVWSEAQGKFVPVNPRVTPVTGDFNTAGDHTVYAVTTDCIRVIWLYAQATVAMPDGAAVEVTFKLGSQDLYHFELSTSQPFMHRATFEGVVGEDLVVNLSDNRRVLVNGDIQLFAPTP